METVPYVSFVDSVTASLIQMQEVNSGYKHSLDASSKRRVREVCTLESEQLAL